LRTHPVARCAQRRGERSTGDEGGRMWGIRSVRRCGGVGEDEGAHAGEDE
jgi:hypothetical protein